MEEMNKEKTRSFWLGLLTGAAAAGAVLTLVVCVLIFVNARDKADNAFTSSKPSATNPFNIGNQTVEKSDIIDDEVISKVNRIDELIDRYFYFEENVDEEDMKTAIYDGILASLDDRYSVYYTPEELEQMFTESDGRYYGIGSYVTIDETSNLPMLSGVFEDSPAQKAGLRDGDLISEVDGATTQGLSLTEVVTLIKGPIDTDVVLTIIREGESDYLHITVTRGSVETPTVKHRMLDNNIGYLQITEFDDVTLSQFENAYDDLKKSGMKGLIIDLRSNPGGNLDTVVGICDDILPAGIITYTVDKYGNREEYACHGTDPIDIPLAVLVNEYSASASELMTGAIRDYKVGVVVGKNTFGKGIVQQIYTLSDGSGIKLTTSRYYTPNGECIHEVGIAPDIEVELDTDLYYAEESVDTQLNAAVEYIEGQIK
jgi:carboxyl-terminal processing protease